MTECCQKRNMERDPQELDNLKKRINRIIGQMNGIAKMLDENRYCGEILNQVAAANSALRSLAYLILQTHMNTCIKDKVLSGEDKAMDELLEIVKRLR